MLTKSGPPTLVSKEISSESTSDSEVEKNTEAKTVGPTEKKQPSRISDESKRTINPQAESTEDRTASDPASKGKINEVPEVEKSTERLIAANISFQPTKKKRSRKQTETKIGLEIAKSSSNFIKKESTRNQLTSNEVLSESKTHLTKKESASSTVSSKQLNGGIEEVIAQKPGMSENEIIGSKPLPEDQKSAEANVVAKAVLPKDGNELKSDSVLPPKVDSTINLATASKDSVRKELAKRKFGFELGLSVHYVQQKLTVQNAAQTGAEQEMQSPVSLRPVFGGNLQFKMMVPIGTKFSLLPLLETSVLHRQMTFQKEPGASAPVKLIYTSEGISGSPVLKPSRYSVATWYWLPGAGMELGYVPSPAFSMRAGIVFSQVFFSQTAQKPGFSQPGMWLAAQYQLQRFWSLRTEIRRMEMSAQLLPSASSNSRNLFLGFGFVRSW
jgi:hypothetical protein